MNLTFPTEAAAATFRDANGRVERSCYLLSLAGMGAGFRVHFLRSQVEAATSIPFFPLNYERMHFIRVSSGSAQAYFNGSACSRANRIAVQVSRDKTATKAALAKAGVRVPFGGLVTFKDTQLLATLEAAGIKRVVLKPIDGSLKRGVLLRIPLEQARDHVMRHPHQAFIAEQFVTGDEVRVNVVGKRVVSALQLVPQHVVGDGQHSIADLINQANAKRSLNPLFAETPLDEGEISKTLAMRGDSRFRIPAAAETVWLTTTNLTPHPDRIPYALSRSAQETCVRATRVLGLDHTGLDVIINRAGEAFILEANARPGISNQSFPHPVGEWNLNVPSAILGHYFPQHKPVVRKISAFDFAGLRDEVMRASRHSEGVDAADFAVFEPA